jgi:hypothetical protein
MELFLENGKSLELLGKYIFAGESIPQNRGLEGWARVIAGG